MRLARIPSGLTLVAGFAALAGLAAGLGGCFSPDLGKTPFQCAPTGKRCPDGYGCVKSKFGREVCVEGAEEEPRPPDAAPPDKRILTDAELMPTKEGPVFFDGNVPKSSSGCVDSADEPNNSADKATVLTGQGMIPNWEICYPGDIDQYAITLKAGQKLAVKVKFYNSKGDLDAALADPKGVIVDDSRGTSDNELVGINAAEMTGTYILGVWGFNHATNKYDLELTISN